MNETANKPLSDELYKLSGWFDPNFPSRPLGESSDYSLGYLLKKIQEKLPKGEYIGLSADNNSQGSWFASISNDHSLGDTAYGDTPEDATAKLGIELFKLGVLKK